WWQLLPRLDLWVVLGAWLSTPFITRPLSHNAVANGEITLWLAMALCVAVGIFAVLLPDPALQGQIADSQSIVPDTDDTSEISAGDWVAYGRSAYGDRYAPARQITPANVAMLKLAWTYHTGDFKGP